MQRALLLGLALLLAGCDATTGGYYNQTVKSWRGGNSNDLLRLWGQPDETLASPGKVLYVYRRQSSHDSHPTYSPTVGVHAREKGVNVVTTPPTINSPMNRSPTSYCVTVFTATPQGKIIDTDSQGTNCFSGIPTNLANPKGAAS